MRLPVWLWMPHAPTAAICETPVHQEAEGAPGSALKLLATGIQCMWKHLNTQIHQITRTSTRHHGITLKHCPLSSPLLAAGMATEEAGEICTPCFFFQTLLQNFCKCNTFVNCPVNDFLFLSTAWSTAMFSSVKEKGGKGKEVRVCKARRPTLSGPLYLPKTLSYSSSMSSTIWFW